MQGVAGNLILDVALHGESERLHDPAERCDGGFGEALRCAGGPRAGHPAAVLAADLSWAKARQLREVVPYPGCRELLEDGELLASPKFEPPPKLRRVISEHPVPRRKLKPFGSIIVIVRTDNHGSPCLTRPCRHEEIEQRMKQAESDLDPRERDARFPQPIGQPCEHLSDGPIFETGFHDPSGSVEQKR